eukprot:1927896-Rhodomonas_salina.1
MSGRAGHGAESSGSYGHRRAYRPTIHKQFREKRLRNGLVRSGPSRGAPSRTPRAASAPTSRWNF